MNNGYILVTGSTRGIGAAIAVELASLGFKVAGLTRSGKTAAGEGFICDVTDEAGIAKAVAQVAGRGPIAGLINNAGLYAEHHSDKITAAEFEHIMRTNATSVVVGAREVYPHLKRAGGGLIVNIGSFFDKLGVAENVAYCASKAAVGAITRCLAVEWARDAIRVVNVAPGYIETDLNRDFLSDEKTKRWLDRRVPVGRAGTSDEVARFVASLYATPIPYLTGETIYLDGGHGMNH